MEDNKQTSADVIVDQVTNQPEFDTSSQQSGAETTGSPSVDYAAIRDKYQSQGIEKGREEGFKQAQQQLINENILDEYGRPTSALSQFIEQQNHNHNQNQQYPTNDNDQQSMSQDNMGNMVQAFEMMQATKNVQSTAERGIDKYGDEWKNTAKFFMDDSQKDEDAPSVIYEASSRENGHEILSYLHKNPSEFEKFKGMKPRLLKVAMNNLSKTLRNTSKETPVEPLSESKNAVASASSSGLSDHEKMMNAKKFLRSG